jgi:hypothetical protein
MYMHDIRMGGAIISITCEGSACELCAADPAAAKRANNQHFPHELGEEPPA